MARTSERLRSGRFETKSRPSSRPVRNIRMAVTLLSGPRAIAVQGRVTIARAKQHGELQMNSIVKSVAALSLAGTLALAVATPSQAAPRGAWVGGAIVAGAIVGAAVANAQANAYYGPYGYYGPGY